MFPEVAAAGEKLSWGIRERITSSFSFCSCNKGACVSQAHRRRRKKREDEWKMTRREQKKNDAMKLVLHVAVKQTIRCF